MIWKQKTQNNIYEYYTEDFIGKITLISEVLLSPQTLDACYLNLMNGSSTEGEIKANEGIIKYILVRNNDWIDED